jgi:hypothetical protein
MHESAGPLGGIDDLMRRAIEHFVIEGFHPNPNAFACLGCHVIPRKFPLKRRTINLVAAKKSVKASALFFAVLEAQGERICGPRGYLMNFRLQPG